jgi:hypothetical protein
MTYESLVHIQKRIRSPRSAALTGILYSVLLIASMLLIMKNDFVTDSL